MRWGDIVHRVLQVGLMLTCSTGAVSGARQELSTAVSRGDIQAVGALPLADGIVYFSPISLNAGRLTIIEKCGGVLYREIINLLSNADTRQEVILACVAVVGWGSCAVDTVVPESHGGWVILLSPYRQHSGSAGLHCKEDAGVLYRDFLGK